MTGRIEILVHASLIGLLGCGVAPPDATASSANTTTTHTSSMDDESGTTGPVQPDLTSEGCSPESKVEIELTAEHADTGVVSSSCTVTLAERDDQVPGRWHFAFECLHPVELDVVFDPPLDVAPFSVGDVLSGQVTDDVVNGAVWQLLELKDQSWQTVLAVLHIRGPAHQTTDEPSSGTPPFTFHWAPEPECSTMDATCGVVEQLRLDASTDNDLLTLDPSQRYGTLFEPPNRTYGLWVGDSWMGDCDGQPTWVLNYALALLIPI